MQTVRREGRRWRDPRWTKTHCGICGQETNYHPKMGLCPVLCWDCQQRHKEYLRRQGLGGGTCKAACIDCGREIITTYGNARRTRCSDCRKRHEAQKKAEQEPVINTAARDLRFYEARFMLSKQGMLDKYEVQLALIQRHLYEPRRWDSPIEIIVTAEFLRRNYKVVTQKKVAGHRFDLYIPELHLLVECDGIRVHGTVRMRKKDLEFDAAAILLGYRVTRIAAKDAMEDLVRSVSRAMENATDASTYGLEADAERFRHLGKQEKWAVLDMAVRRIEAHHRRYNRKRYAVAREGRR